MAKAKEPRKIVAQPIGPHKSDLYSHLVTLDLLDTASTDYDKVNEMLVERFHADKKDVSTTWIVIHSSDDARDLSNSIQNELQRMARSGELSATGVRLLVTRLTSVVVCRKIRWSER